MKFILFHYFLYNVIYIIVIIIIIIINNNKLHYNINIMFSYIIVFTVARRNNLPREKTRETKVILN